MNWVEDPFEFIPTGPVSLSRILFSPQVAATRRQDVTVFRGQGTPIQFDQSGTPVSISLSDYVATVGVRGQEPLIYSQANGNLLLSGTSLILNWTQAQTASLSLVEAVYLQLWRIDADDNRTPVAYALLKINDTSNP